MRLCHTLTCHHASRSRYPRSCHVADEPSDTSHPAHIEDWWDNRNSRNTPTSIRPPGTTQTAAFTTSVREQPTPTTRGLCAYIATISCVCLKKPAGTSNLTTAAVASWHTLCPPHSLPPYAKPPQTFIAHHRTLCGSQSSISKRQRTPHQLLMLVFQVASSPQGARKTRA